MAGQILSWGGLVFPLKSFLGAGAGWLVLLNPFLGGGFPFKSLLRAGAGARAGGGRSF